MRNILFILIAASLVACGAQTRKLSSVPAKPSTFTVIATTDFHGALEGEETTSADGKKVTIGDASVMAAYIKILRQKISGPTIYLDAGDLFQGTMASNLYEGAPVVRIYNYLNVAAAALGNHEFDYGPAGEKAVPRGPNDDPRGALKERIREAKFPFLAANVTENGKIPSWLKASIIVEVDGVKIGIVGAASPGTPGSTNALNLVGLKFTDAEAPVRAEAERLRSQGVDVVVLIIHEGGGCENNWQSKQDDLSTCKLTDIFDLVKKFPEGLIDVVVAGHTHWSVAKRIGRTAIIQPGSNGKFVGWATVPLADKGERPFISELQPVCAQVLVSGEKKTCEPYLVKKLSGTLEPAKFMGEVITPDSKVTALISKELSEVKARKERALGGSITGEFARNYNSESPLANLMADVVKESVPGLDIGLQNAGGVRDNLRPGPMTYGSVFAVLPFDNQLAVMKIPGAKVTELVKIGIFGGQGVYDWSANLHAKVENCDLKELTINGKPIDPNKIYSVATSDFLAGGGSGVSKAKIPQEMVEVYWDRPYILRDLAADVFSRWKKELRPDDYFNARAPRLEISGKCGSGAQMHSANETMFHND